MISARSRLTGLVLIHQFVSYGQPVTQIAYRYSTSRSSESAEGSVMFHRATKEHTSGFPKPLQSNPARGNEIVQPKPASPSKGVKRKLEMANSGNSTLGSLHSEVYFEEDDFSDDDELDFNKPDPVIVPKKFEPPETTRKGHIEHPNTHAALSPPSLPKQEDPTARNGGVGDVKYPDLPPIPDDEPPPSTIHYPWSSSPPSHFQQPPPKRRTLPWKKHEELDAQNRQKAENNRNFTTPARPKQTLPWNKSASAIKEEQKELRRQYKNQKEDANSKKHQPRTKIASIFLSDEQRGVLEAVANQGKSIFFTGSAGTGKSVLMREIISTLRKKYDREKDRVAITASTGLAACNIEGVTLHSFAGIGLGKDPVPELVKKIKRNQKARNRWLRTKILVIDEVSMVDGDLFDKLEEIARRIRNNGRPFGGIQLVVTGDFFQLPPVPEGNNREAKFAFSASTWNTCIQHTILLTHVFRQKDPQFAEMLNEMRLGKISPRTIEAFKQLSRPLDFHDSLEATELFPTRAEVENANSARMVRLSGETMTFNSVDSGTIQDIQMRDRLLANCMAPPTIHLKKGAQVMLIKNMEDTLVNGSIGRVVAFMDEATYGFYTENEYEFAGDGDLSDDERASRARKKIKSMINKDGGIVASKKWPLVCFVLPDGTERHLLCHPETWKIELPNGEVQAQRQQIPLILAWALSIHKAQGQTLQRVKVDLGRVFEKGQAYVALSRATSQAGLQITRFEPRKVMVHPKVVDFYSNLTSISQVLKSKKSSSAQKPGSEFDDDLDDESLAHIYG